MAADQRAKGLAWIALPFAAALVTALGRLAGANATTAGFAYLLLVLGLATWGGWAVGAAASVVAMACFNFFFLPPYGTLTIQDPSNWVALVTFLVASTVASRLVATARRRAEEAQSRRREVEILYDLCFGLFAASQRPGILGEAAARTLQAIGAESGGLYLAGEEAPVTTLGGDSEVDRNLLQRALETREIAEAGATAYLPLHVAGTVNGVLVARGRLAPAAGSRSGSSGAARTPGPIPRWRWRRWSTCWRTRRGQRLPAGRWSSPPAAIRRTGSESVWRSWTAGPASHPE